MPVPQREPGSSRRELRRQATIDEIKSRALEQLAANGYGGLSLRAVAREMGMSSPAIFRYFPAQADLVTALCIDAYEQLADAIDSARVQVDASEPVTRMRAVFAAVRQWSLRNPAQFALLFGTPIPGYHAPESATGPAAGRMIAAMMQTYAQAIDAGAVAREQLDVPAGIEAGELAPGDLGIELFAPYGPDVSSPWAAILHNAWVSILGFIISELWGNLTRLVADTDPLFDSHLTTVLRGMGFATT
ncbi:TetR/AcrR family transcriptional regulator [Nocardia brasiliensis]